MDTVLQCHLGLEHWALKDRKFQYAAALHRLQMWEASIRKDKGCTLAEVTKNKRRNWDMKTELKQKKDWESRHDWLNSLNTSKMLQHTYSFPCHVFSPSNKDSGVQHQQTTKGALTSACMTLIRKKRCCNVLAMMPNCRHRSRNESKEGSILRCNLLQNKVSSLQRKVRTNQ